MAGNKGCCPERRPHFFKVFLPELNSERLQIPLGFLKHLKGQTSGTAYLTGPGKNVWRVDLVRRREGLYFEHGWEVFLSDHSSQFGDFFVFRYDGNLHFTVQIFDQSGCIKEATFRAKCNQDQDNKDVVKNNGKKRRQNEELPPAASSDEVCAVSRKRIKGSSHEVDSVCTMNKRAAEPLNESVKSALKKKAHKKKDGEDAVKHSLVETLASPHGSKKQTPCRAGLHYSSSLNDSHKVSKYHQRTVLDACSDEVCAVPRKGIRGSSHEVDSVCTINNRAAEPHDESAKSALKKKAHRKEDDAVKNSLLESLDGPHGGNKHTPCPVGLHHSVSQNGSHNVRKYYQRTVSPSSKKIHAGSSKGDQIKFLHLNYSNTKKAIRSRESITTNASGYLVSQRRDVSIEERKRALEAADAFKTKNPAVVMVMRAYHVCTGFYLGLPNDFVNDWLPQESQEMILWDPNGKPWPVKYINRGGLSGGWGTFVRHNNLEIDDVCVLELIKPNEMQLVSE
ncbi:PREDICTED: B3 domain-containing protein Os11g0197600-like isoform X2 [Nelumbo nucifera]|uniref:B3 domain-containing protein Os11g0197600-like isoform X2 n=1 Tax=Nelumbo nucifera TaxID=4432 RepID=A0A1U8A8U4_NELNU|nr:PREDICTED: B3 domain-containing protein Os11g0197600-like isoform X2 [Nelumbo nucifera]